MIGIATNVIIKILPEDLNVIVAITKEMLLVELIIAVKR
jgi:hypothetical protein